MRELYETMVAQLGQLDIWQDLRIDPRVQSAALVATDEAVAGPTRTEDQMEDQYGLSPVSRQIAPDYFQTPAVVCSFCHLTGHTEDVCLRRCGACLVCGSFEHRVALSSQLSSAEVQRPSSVGVIRIDNTTAFS